jgi:hypothetical protein
MRLYIYVCMYIFIYVRILLQFELRSDAKAIVHNELEGMEKEAAVVHFESLFRICLRGHK